MGNLLDNLFLPKKNTNEFTLDKYVHDLESGVFADHMVLGISEEKIDWLRKRFEQEPNGLYIGAMGSGKSIAANFTILTWMLANSHKTILFIIDSLKGANDYSALFKYPQVFQAIGSDTKVLRVLDLIYDEAMARRDLFTEVQAENINAYERKTNKVLSRVVTLIEEFHAIPYNILDFDRNYKIEGTAAFKFHQLMKIGRSYGIWFVACSQKGTKSDVPSEIVPNFTQKQIFRVSRAEASYFLADTKAADIRTEQKGRCQTDYGAVQFPYITDSTQERLLAKYMKTLDAESAYLTPKLITDYLGGKSTEDLYKLKKLSDLCKGIETYDAELVITILHKKLGHTVEVMDSKIDPAGIALIVDWKGKTKVAISLRVKQKLSNKHIVKLKKGMQENNCPRGVIYTSADDLPQSLYKLAIENNIEIVDHEDLVRLARIIEANKAEGLTPDHLAEDGKESGSYQVSNHIPDVEFKEDEEILFGPKVTIAKDAETKYIKDVNDNDMVSQVIDEGSFLNDDKKSELSDNMEEASDLADQMMIKQYTIGTKQIKRLPIKSIFSLPASAHPKIIMNLDRNKSGDVYRLECFVIDHRDQKIITKYFLDRQVKNNFSTEEMDQLNITGSNDWNSQFDSINNRKVMNDEEFNSEMIAFLDNLKSYDMGNVSIVCWKEDVDFITQVISKSKHVKKTPACLEDIYEGAFGEYLEKDTLLFRLAKNVKESGLFYNLDKTYEIYKVVF